MDENSISNEAVDSVVEESMVQESEQPLVQEAEQKADQKAERETSQQLNFRLLREENERLAREREDAMRKLQEKQQPVPEEDPEDIADKRYVKQNIRSIEDQLALMSLKIQYPDFESVVNKANVQTLEREDPEMLDLIYSSNNDYKKAVALYRSIKKMGIGASKDFDRDKERVEKNSTKPRSVASVSPQEGGGALSKANIFAGGLTPELKRQLREEMDRARRRS